MRRGRARRRCVLLHETVAGGAARVANAAGGAAGAIVSAVPTTRHHTINTVTLVGLCAAMGSPYCSSVSVSAPTAGAESIDVSPIKTGPALAFVLIMRAGSFSGCP